MIRNKGMKLWTLLLAMGMFLCLVSCNDDDNDLGPDVSGAKVISTDEEKDGFYDGTFYYRIFDVDSKTLVVCGPSKKLSGYPTIPEHVKLTSKNLPSVLRTTFTVTYIGEWSLVDSSIRAITFPSSLVKIGEDAFFRCTSLTTISLPASVKEIGKNAFLSCNNLKTVYCYATNPPTNNDAFSYEVRWNGTLHVPAASLSRYKSNAQWNNFNNIIGDL